MTDFEAKKLICPCCSHEFESKLVTSFTIDEKDTDFCPKYVGGNPLPEFLHVCPECGFIGFETDYRTLTDEKTIKRVNTLLGGFHWTKNQILSGAERYRRTALIGIYAGKRSAEVADLYLQATWCSRMEGEDDDEQKGARRKAVKYFELALAAEEFSPDDMPVVHYLLGELSRRLGDDKKAIKHFNKMDDLEKVDPWLIEWRDKQRALIKQ